ncbi:hypothetical protein AAHE18_14G137400 [Arachis hypogaea]
MDKAESSIIEMVCKLEKNFSPAFFDVIEHLFIYIPYEAKPRYMLYLKRKVRNKARVDGFICEAYILEEISNFTSMYFESTVQTRRTQVHKNNDGDSNMGEYHLSIFRYRYVSIGRGSKKYLTAEELYIAHTYILDSLKELDSNIFDDEILNACDKDFSRWIKNQIAHGPFKSFHTKNHDKNRATMNSGVCVKGNIYGKNDLDYYGILEEILELSYLGYENTIFIFQCCWLDPISRVKVDERYGLVDIKYKSRLQSNEPFVLAEQAQEVYYTKYLHSGYKSSGEWWAACKVRAKLFMNETLHDPDEHPNEQADSNDFYQESVSELRVQSVVLEDEVISLFDANAPMEEVNVEEIN